jgi:hypothetical protein
MGLRSVLEGGGKVIVVGGTMNPNWSRFKDHPQIVFWTGSQSEIERHLKNGDNFPPNVKGVILSRFLSHSQGGKVIAEAKRKRALIMNGQNDGEVTRLLEQLTTPEPKPEPEAPRPILVKKELRPPKHGEIGKLLQEHYKPDVPNIDAARKLLKIAEEKGIKSTEGSMQQAIYAFKKKLGLTSPTARTSHGVRVGVVTAPGGKKTVETIQPRKETRIQDAKTTQIEMDEITPLLKIVDDIQASFSLLRDALVRMHEQGEEYRRLKEKLSSLKELL